VQTSTILQPSRALVEIVIICSIAGGVWAYLATWMDLFSRKVVGWAVLSIWKKGLNSSRPRDEKALTTPATSRSKQVSDRGGQYAGKCILTTVARAHLRHQ